MMQIFCNKMARLLFHFFSVKKANYRTLEIGKFGNSEIGNNPACLEM